METLKSFAGEYEETAADIQRHGALVSTIAEQIFAGIESGNAG